MGDDMENGSGRPTGGVKRLGSGECACPHCAEIFVCGVAAGEEKCWCEELPPLQADHGIKGCYCPNCLPVMIEKLAAPA
jgi:hypothetical protein